MNWRRAALWCIAVTALVFGVVSLAAALALHRPEWVRPWVERALTPRGGTASLAGLKLSIAPPSVEISGLMIKGPAPEGDLLRLERLRVEPVPGRIFRAGPWLRRVAASGLVYERTRPRETEGTPDLTPITRLFDIEELALSDARFRIALAQGELSADGVRISLNPGEGGGRRFEGNGKLAFRRQGSAVAEGSLAARGTVTAEPAIAADLELASARLTLPWLSGDVSGKARLRVDPKRIQATELTLLLPQARPGQGRRAIGNFGPIRLDASAGATLDGKDLRLEVSRLDIGGMLMGRGEADGPAPERISGAFEGEIPRVERLRAALSPLLPAILAGMDLSGRLPFRIGTSGREAERALALELAPRDLRFSWPAAGVGLNIAGPVRMEGPLRDWIDGKAALAGRVRGTGNLGKPPVAVRAFRFDAPLAGTVAAPASTGWKLSAGAGEATFEGRPIPLGTVGISGSATSAGRSFRATGVDIRSGSLGRLKGELAFREGKPSGRLDGKNLPADNLVRLAGALGGKNTDGWSPAGSVDLSARLETGKGGSRITAALSLGGIVFNSPSGDLMAQKLTGKADLEALLPLPRLKADLALHGGEALWGTVYVDLAKAPLEVHATGTREGPDDYKDLSLAIGLEGYGRLKIDGSARRAGNTWRHQGRVALTGGRLGPIFRTFLRDPLAASQPGLAGLEMEGGAEAALSFSGSGRAADVVGSLRVNSGGVRGGEGPPLLSGFEVALPIEYSLGTPDPGRPAPRGAERWGRLRLEKIRLAGQELGPLEMPAALVPNRLYLDGAVDTSLLGANVSLRGIRVERPLSPDFRIVSEARLAGLDLARVAGGKALLEGSLNGLLDPVSIGRDRMTAEGELTGELFGGRMEIRNVTVERPFGEGREIGADVEADRIDLERLTAALGAGRVTGRLSASVSGLRVAYGQPVAFHLKAESVPVKGVDQSVSIKAVNSISQVGTGSSLSGMGVSLMTSIFREFAYEKIGVECTLNNDVFILRGLIREDGLEYLVKRRFLSGINVINRNPDNRISFSDMVERARRVTRERSE